MPLVLTPRSISGGAMGLPAPVQLEAGSIAIGRGSDVNLMLNHPHVSARHCMIVGQGGSWQIQDSSTNGTLLNGHRLTGVQTLRHGDVIGIADIELLVAIGEAAQSRPAPGMHLDDWSRPPAAPPTMAPQPAPAQPAESTAGALLKASIAGVVAMAQARSKARRELGVPTNDKPENPLLSAASPDAALARLLVLPPAAATQMVTEAIVALEAHQRATLAAMQGSFRAALDQFAPEAIKARAPNDAAAWKSYEKAFRASDGFVEVFAKELADAYRKNGG